jgi:hypothetical protein
MSSPVPLSPSEPPLAAVSVEVEKAVLAAQSEQGEEEGEEEGEGGDIGGRVTKARSLLTAQVEATYSKLLAPHLLAYAADEIDEVTLGKCKVEAREAAERAAATNGGGTDLERALWIYEQAEGAASAAAEAARAAVDAARVAAAAKSKAKAELVARLHAIEHMEHPNMEQPVNNPSQAAKRALATDDAAAAKTPKKKKGAKARAHTRINPHTREGP